MATLKDLERALKNIGKQVKFAHAQALTQVARKIEQEERRPSTKRKKRGRVAKQKGNLKLLIRYGDAMPVQKKMDFYGVAEETINRELPSAMQGVIQRAFDTSK